MIKVPATRQLLIEGINVNVTLLFSVGRYLEVLAAYMDALEARQAATVMHGLSDLGIDMRAIDDELEQEGIEKFIKPYESVLETLRAVGEPA
jgi:transaldolase